MLKMNSIPTIPIANQTRGYPPQTRTSFLSGVPDGSGFDYYSLLGTSKKEAKNACAPGTLAKTHLQLEKTARKTRGRSDSSGLEFFLIVNVPAKGAREG